MPKSILAALRCLHAIDATRIIVRAQAHMDGHTVFERGHADEGVVTASETGGLLFLSLCFAWFLLPLRLLASHLNALDLERYPDLGTDNNLCIPLGATVDGEEAPVGLACSKRLAHMWEIVHKSNCRDASPRH